MNTELIWEGKYDEFGRRRPILSNSFHMPLQKIETIDEPHSRSIGQRTLFDVNRAHRDNHRNLLIWGDNKVVVSSLLAEYRSRLRMIYIDPPFDVGADFTMEIPIGDGSEEIEKDQSVMEMVAYRDIWGHGTNSYLHMMYERIALAKDLLTEDGSIFIHVDYRVSSYLRLILDEIFGAGMLKNEIIWCYTGPGSPGMRQYSRKHDTIWWFSKSNKWVFNDKDIRVSHHEKTKDNFRKGLAGSGFVSDTYDLNEKGKIPEDWWNMAIAARFPVDGIRRTGYATEKPMALLERILLGASDQDDIVGDIFCGSGTFLAAAEIHGRRWIGCDLGRFAIHTARKRLIGLQRELHHAGEKYRSFDVYNLGRYERQWWQKEALKGADQEHRTVVLKFFRAEPLSQAPSPLIHARKGVAFVHVDGIDSVFTRGELTAVAEAVKAAGGREVHVLAWDFEMDLRQVVTAVEAEFGVKVRLHRIPREIMERNRTEVPPFFEVALLEAEPIYRKEAKGRKAVEIKLTGFLPSLTEVPSKELEALQERAVESGFDFIDFWAIDFDWKPGQPFNHHWQDYRTRKDRSLKTVSDAEFVYDTPGRHTACVKVVDVFGCDTSITVEIEA